MDVEKLIEKFKEGCETVLGEIEERKRTIICWVNDDQKIVLDKKGRWVKTYDMNRPDLGLSSLATWAKLKDIKVDKERKEMIIEIEGDKPIEVGIQVIYSRFTIPPKKLWDFGFIFSDPEYIAPEFKETFLKQRLIGHKYGRGRRKI